jgi:ATP synthase F1 gamma subunit
MRRPNAIAAQEASLSTLAELTGAFEGIASMRIAQIKEQVMQSSQFFNDLWAIYVQVRSGTKFQFGRESDDKTLQKDLYIIITAEGGFSGDIDNKLVSLMLKEYDKTKIDILVVGHHGAMQLAQRGVGYKKYFKLPTKDRDINVTPITKEIRKYKTTKLFYQQYVSLMVQDVKRIELSNVVNDLGAKSSKAITTENYIFEPSTYAVTAHLENSMMQIAVGQLILESKLAQYASRFRAMSVSHELADTSKDQLHLDFNRARRAVKDERLKEIISGVKHARSEAA